MIVVDVFVYKIKDFLFYNMIIDYLLKITRAIFYGDNV